MRDYGAVLKTVRKINNGELVWSTLNKTDTSYVDVELVYIFLACCACAAQCCVKFIPVSLYRFYTEITI